MTNDEIRKWALCRRRAPIPKLYGAGLQPLVPLMVANPELRPGLL